MKNRSKRQLNIAHLHWGFPPIVGGVETHLTILLPELVRMGHNVSLLTCPAPGVSGESSFKGVKIFRVPIMDLNWLFKRGLNGIEDEVNKAFNEFIDKSKPDVIHTHNMHYFSIAHARILARIAKSKGIPLFLTAHNVWGNSLFLSMMREIKWAHIIAVSHFIRHELIGIGLKHKNITTIHHGVDQDFYRPGVKTASVYKKYPQLKNRSIVFHPARMGLAKGCDVSVKALRIIAKEIPDVMLVLAGTKNIVDWGDTQKKDIAYIVELVDFFKLRKNILIDAYKLEDMPALYSAARVVIYPSSSPEPFGLTMLESMASAKPIVVTNTGGMPEIISDSVNGFVVPIYHFEDLANRVIQLLGDKDLCNRLGKTGRSMVEHSFTREVVTESTLAVYRKFV